MKTLLSVSIAVILTHIVLNIGGGPVDKVSAVMAGLYFVLMTVVTRFTVSVLCDE